MDVIGAWHPVMQYHFPLLKNFVLRQVIIHANSMNRVEYKVETYCRDDYEGQTFWLSVKTKHFFSETTAFRAVS